MQLIAKFPLFFVNAIVLLLLTTTLVAADFSPTVVFLHRHGARSPQGVINGRTNCGYPLCQLTEAGKAMCYSVGQYLNEHFISKLTPSAAGNYDVKKIRTESTDTKRTVQSAESVLFGMYSDKSKNNGETITPFVNFVPTQIDYNMSFWSSWPYWRIGNVMSTRLGQREADYIRGEFTNVPGSGNLLEQYGKLLGAETICAKDPVDCLLLFADVLECNTSNGQPLDPLLSKHKDLIRTAKVILFSRLMGYHPEDKDNSVKPGGFGYYLGIEILESLQYKAVKVDDWPIDVHHYSAHDWTLFPLYSAFGFWNPSFTEDPAWIPQFVDTLVFVTTDKGIDSATGKQKLGVKAFRLAPEQVPQGDPSHWTSFPVKGHVELGIVCTPANAAAGKATTTLSNESATGCDIEDVMRTVARVAPTVNPGGKCFASEQDLNAAGCLSDAAPGESSSCEQYRAVCNQLPCGQVPQAGVNFETGDGFTKLSDPQRGFACTDTDPLVDGDYPIALAATLVSVGFVVGSAVGGVVVWLMYAKYCAAHFADSPGVAPGAVQQQH